VGEAQAGAEGRSRWTMQLLADRLVELQVVNSISDECVRETLKRGASSRGWTKSWCIPIPTVSPRFVWRMEDVLELYAEPQDACRPLVCLDEKSLQLVRQTRQPIPAAPGRAQRIDYEYERVGTANLFLFFAPLIGWRHVKVTAQRTAADFAKCMSDLVRCHFPHAEVIRVVLDNLNTHTPAALYERFPPDVARALAKKLEFHYTPEHASWLNMAEVELSVLTGQCLKRRLPDADTAWRQIAAWEVDRNAQQATVDWRFTATDARGC